MDCIVYGVTKSRTRLSDFHFQFFHFCPWGVRAMSLSPWRHPNSSLYITTSFKNKTSGRLLQDGGVEGHVLTSSCESAKIIANCWTIIDRTTLEKKVPHVKRQRRSHNKRAEGMQSRKNQISYLLDGQPTNWKTIIPQRFSHCWEGSEPQVRLHNLGIWQRD